MALKRYQWANGKPSTVKAPVFGTLNSAKQLSNLICQNCDGSIKLLLDVENRQHAV